MAKKFYAVRKGRKTGIYTDWETAKAQVEGVSNEYKSFLTEADAIAYLRGESEFATGQIEEKKRAGQKKKQVYIGSDEVGKGEPLRRLIVVSAYVDDDPEHQKLRKKHYLENDSKVYAGVSDPRIMEAGRSLTDFCTFEDCKDGIYENEEYGVVYAIRSITNRQLNQMHENNCNQNKILSILHNRVNEDLYQEMTRRGRKPECVVIDNYMGEYSYKFSQYLADVEEKKLFDEKDLQIDFCTKAEAKYPAVACASVIGSYIEALWQNKVCEDLMARGGNPDCLSFGNTGAGVLAEFDELERVYGSLEAEEIDIKHTEHYRKRKQKQ